MEIDLNSNLKLGRFAVEKINSSQICPLFTSFRANSKEAKVSARINASNDIEAIKTNIIISWD